MRLKVFLESFDCGVALLCFALLSSAFLKNSLCIWILSRLSLAIIHNTHILDCARSRIFLVSCTLPVEKEKTKQNNCTRVVHIHNRRRSLLDLGWRPIPLDRCQRIREEEPDKKTKANIELNVLQQSHQGCNHM